MTSSRRIKDHLEKVARRLQLPRRTVAFARHVLQRLNKEHKGYIQGLKPLDVAVSCLYVAGLLTGEGPTQNDLCRAADWKITASTIRKHYRNIAEKFQFPPLLAICRSRRLPRREKYLCPLCGEYTKNLDLWKSHLKQEHQLRGWGQAVVRARDFDMEGNLANPQILKRIREAERQQRQAKETLKRVENESSSSL
jgi:DNA-binding CsgD family transcriptional regulator